MNEGTITGPLLEPERMALYRRASRLYVMNPFDPAREELVKAAVGSSYMPEDCAPGHNRRVLYERIGVGLAVTSRSLAQGVVGTPEEIAAYRGAARYFLLDAFGHELQAVIDADEVEAPFYEKFVEHHGMLFGRTGVPADDPAHLFAVLYQARRAWYFAASRLLGRSPSAVAARAAVYRANLGGGLDRYAAGLYLGIEKVPVLITGETGTGKELSAQCVGWSHYIPFDGKKRRFAARYTSDFHARNLSEVSPELIDSTLFGHKKGSFTGATADATGWFALPGENGTLFLDEVGEMILPVQVKLLRPLQNRECVPVGELRPRKIHGRHIYATRRDLEAMCREGRFREDLHERMKGMLIHMPSLRQMLAELPAELRGYVRAFVGEQYGDPVLAETWTGRVYDTICATLPGYDWPRNLRELHNYTERCLRSDELVTVPETLPPPAERAPRTTAERPPEDCGAPESPGLPESVGLPSSGLLGPVAKEGNVPVDEVMRDLVTRVSVLTGQNQSETSRRTGLNWRTVGRMIDPDRLARWLKDPPEEPDPT
jgi:DNA-binding NtrC family response regulator